MTREEKIALLIDELEDIRCDNFDANTDEDKTLKEVVRAIKVLEQEPCDKYIKEIDHLRKYISKLETQIVEQQPCEDAISRSEVLDLIDSKDPDYKVIHFKEDVECLPPVTPQPKIGHWIHWASGDDCSECGWSTGKYIPMTKFCPDCGAKMEVEE